METRALLRAALRLAPLCALLPAACGGTEAGEGGPAVIGEEKHRARREAMVARLGAALPHARVGFTPELHRAFATHPASVMASATRG